MPSGYQYAYSTILSFAGCTGLRNRYACLPASCCPNGFSSRASAALRPAGRQVLHAHTLAGGCGAGGCCCAPHCCCCCQWVHKWVCAPKSCCRWQWVMANSPARFLRRALLHLHAMVTGTADYRHYYMSALGHPDATTKGHSQCAPATAKAEPKPCVCDCTLSVVV